ncbi:MAG: V-type ATP synthase subunit I [Candidatus Micrarchaeia archaeon]
MLKPAKMQKIRIIFQKDYYEDVLTALHDLGVMQIEQLPEEAAQLLNKGDSVSYKEISEFAQRFRGLESLLIPQRAEKRYVFQSIDYLLESARLIKIDEQASELTRRQEKIEASIKKQKDLQELLAMMPGDIEDLSYLSGKRVSSFLVRCQDKKMQEFKREAKKRGFTLIEGAKALIVAMEKSKEGEFGKLAEEYKASVTSVPEMNGSIARNLEKTREEIEILEKQKTDTLHELQRISERYYPIVSAITEQLDLEMEKLEIMTKLGVGKSVIVVYGWIEESEVPGLSNKIAKITKNRYMVEKVKTNEIPPTLMKNPATAKFFEFFIKFYSIPRSDELDPTMMFAVIFPIFFGFMVGDAGYGAAMLALSLWLLHRIKHPPKKSRIPKSISNFIGMIVSNNGLLVLAKAIIPGALLAIVLGIVFNEYFGFQLPYKALFNVEIGLPKLLVLSGWIGVAMVCSGFIFGFVNRLAVGERKKAVGKLGWLATAIGFVIFGLAVLHRESLGVSNIPVFSSYFMMIGGIATVLAAEGADSLMEIPSLISHMLSYTRLVGILLASVILAGVIDFIFVRSWAHSPLLGIAGTLILIIGQLFTFIIAIFEPGIQGARLIYVEFFSKFFTGNGKEFKPFASKRRLTLSKFEIK